MESPESQNPWYDGSVAEAVQTANANGSILLVCVVQDNVPESDSGLFEARFRKPQVLTTLTEENLISLKLVKDSPDGMMFGQIFPIMVVPALYLIRNGLLTDFMNSTVDEDQMLERIQKAINGHSQIPPPPAAISSPTVAPPLTPQPSASTPPSVTSSPAPPAEAVLAPSVATHVEEPVSPAAPSSSSVSSTPSTPSTSSAPKVDKAEELKELMKQRKLWREREEKEAAKKRELDRRSSSKVLTSAQRELTEKQNKKLKDQIEKEKREEAEYKKRVKQALEEDKARRRAEREKAQAALVASQSSSSLNGPRDQVVEEVLTPHEIRAQNAGLREARNDAAPALACESSRLNIRLFDGSSVRNTFKATDTLEQVRQWINENQEGDENAYNIVQLIPARTFTDETKMLRDLELCPSATLVLKKITSASSAYGGSGSGAVPTLMNYGWSAVSMAGKLASSAYSTVSYYNPLSGGQGSSGSGNGSGSSGGSGGRDGRDDAASSKKKDRETSYNGNSTSLE
ncbi:hypothetical protein MVEG_10523 [Podila verticillata NRRL 6337]|nr:hypothetical protein MVEG_10523 [Podila verticillata NRRL 6337]